MSPSKPVNQTNPNGSKSTRTPVAPYMAVGLSTVVHGIGGRKDIARNLDTIEDGIHAAMSVVSINMPVKLIALADGALTGFTDEAFDLPHTVAAKELFIDVPGEETDRLAKLAKHYETYIIVQCKARWPEVMKNRFFNLLFVIDPKGKDPPPDRARNLYCSRSRFPGLPVQVCVHRTGTG
jgi:beta-ureidopropionase